MKKTPLLLLCLSAWPLCALSQQSIADLYGTGQWNADSLGNHRVVVAVDEPSDAVLAKLDWRRRDQNPEKKDIIVIDATTGKRVTNVSALNVNRERGEIAFQPQTVPGKYYIYYLKYISKGKWYPQVTYAPMQQTASEAWLKKNKLTGKKSPKLPEADLVQYQAISDHHSFYPMEVIATAAEKSEVMKRQPEGKFILFPEDRRYPIRMTKDIPMRWVGNKEHHSFAGTADKGEYYTFQLGVWAARGDVKNLKVEYTAFKNEKTGEEIPVSAFTCINTEGIDVTGTVFQKHCSVDKDKVQALWIGTMVPEGISAGEYKGKVFVSAENDARQAVDVKLTVTSNVIANHGDNETWRHSRLRWLNSQLAFDDEVIAPYSPVQVKANNMFSILGRDIQLASTGFPQDITSYFKETLTEIGTEGRHLLAKPMELSAPGGAWENLDFEIVKHKPGTVAWKALNQNSRFLMQMDGALESDGNLTYKVTLVAREDGTVDDIALRTQLAPNSNKYMMGLGEKGGFCPKSFEWKWDVKKNQDAVWVGNVNAGLQLRFYDNKYERPLNTNFYHQKPLHMPVSWCNAGAGGIKLTEQEGGTLINAYSGRREVKKGDRLYYYFNVLVTPFRTIDTNKQWADRYCHSYKFIDEVKKVGATVANIHHASGINPYINYPFLRPQQMKAYIDGAHAQNIKVKIYNTVRELTNHCTEIFALRSLNGEIFSKGNGGGYSWLQEHYDPDYIAAWFSPNVECAAIVNTGVSRWHNYYMEGLNWLTRNVGIDGIYIDDLAFDRTSMKRVRKILNRANPGALIDLHSANQFNPSDGFANSANLYLEHFPYIDRLWFGEYFNYNYPPEFWMVEVSGIPYGVMGEMLQDGGNPWRGMLYGMTGRYPSVNNVPLWNLWDKFGMKDSKMVGYWVSYNPVKTHSEKTLATIYRHATEKKVLVSLATWEDADAQVQLDIDWKALGIDAKQATLHAPAVEKFQEEQSWKPGETITVPKGKGLLIVIE